MTLYLDRDLEIFWNSRWFQVTITAGDFYVPLALLAEGRYSMSDYLVACCSADPLQVERETSMEKHALSSHLHSRCFQVRREFGIVGIAEQDCFAYHTDPNFLGSISREPRRLWELLDSGSRQALSSREDESCRGPARLGLVGLS